MCELFAMSSRLPTTVTFSLDEFSRHGGGTGPHRDGWGIAYYEDGDVRLIKEAEAAADSACVRFIKEHDFESSLVISHIRKATQGVRALKNTHPFSRELGGRMHVFAHNGKLPGVEGHSDLPLGMYRPIGVTDSESAFCALLARMQKLWLGNGAPPALENRLEVVTDFARVIGDLGPANFIYSDGEVIFAHGHRRAQSDGEFRPPGLWSLCRSCIGEPSAFKASGLTIGSRDERQDVVLVASVPLTEEPWVPLADGEVITMSGGKILGRTSGANPQ